MAKLSENIVVLRHQNKMSQSALAEKLYVTPQAVSRWERGETEPDIETIKKLAEVFNATLEDVINGPETALKKEVKAKVHLGYMISSLIMVIVSVVFSVLSFLDIAVVAFFIILVVVSLLFLGFIMAAEIYMVRLKYTKKPKEKQEKSTKK